MQHIPEVQCVVVRVHAGVQSAPTCIILISIRLGELVVADFAFVFEEGVDFAALLADLPVLA